MASLRTCVFIALSLLAAFAGATPADVSDGTRPTFALPVITNYLLILELKLRRQMDASKLIFLILRPC